MDIAGTQIDIQTIQNYLVALGSGGALGIITGAAIKHTARRIAIALGTVFVFLQVFQYLGYVVVRWDRVTETALPVFDANKDGILTEDDARYMIENAVGMAPEILTRGLPNIAGFATGVILAFWFL